MAPLWSDWMRRLCLALCLALTFACTASATQQRLFIVRALQSHGQARHVPQMLMTLHDRAPELPALDAVILPGLMLLLCSGHSCASNSNFRAHFTFAGHAPIFLDPRGPPFLL